MARVSCRHSVPANNRAANLMNARNLTGPYGRYKANAEVAAVPGRHSTITNKRGSAKGSQRLRRSMGRCSRRGSLKAVFRGGIKPLFTFSN